MVTVVVHQVMSATARDISTFAAVHEVAGRIPGLPKPVPGTGGSVPPLPAAITGIEAITPAQSPDTPSSAVNNAGDLPPRTDSLMRCLRLIADLVRAYRATTEATIALPTYERLPAFVICYSAPARRSQVKVENRPADHIRTTGRWTGPTLVMLEHGNLPDPVMGEKISGTVDSAFGQYMWRLRSGDRGLIYRELHRSRAGAAG